MNKILDELRKKCGTYINDINKDINLYFDNKTDIDRSVKYKMEDIVEAFDKIKEPRAKAYFNIIEDLNNLTTYTIPAAKDELREIGTKRMLYFEADNYAPVFDHDEIDNAILSRYYNCLRDVHEYVKKHFHDNKSKVDIDVRATRDYWLGKLSSFDDDYNDDIDGLLKFKAKISELKELKE